MNKLHEVQLEIVFNPWKAYPKLEALIKEYMIGKQFIYNKKLLTVSKVVIPGKYRNIDEEDYSYCNDMQIYFIEQSSGFDSWDGRGPTANAVEKALKPFRVVTETANILDLKSTCMVMKLFVISPFKSKL